MPIPHSNYYPPANTVQVLDKHGRLDQGWTWDGAQFRHHGHVHKPHHFDTIMGKPGTVMEGWLYDWHHHTWMEPDQPAGIARLPVGGAPAGGPAHPPPHVVVVQPPKEESMGACTHHVHQNSLIDGLKNHPWVPLAGLAVLVISDFMTQPTPPQIPDGLPEVQQKFWIMRYQQNLALYQERRQKLDKWGGIIFGLGTANAAVQANGATALQQHMAQATQRHAAM